MTMVTAEQYPVTFLYDYTLGNSTTEALQNTKRTPGNDSVDIIRTVQRRFQRFRSGNESLKTEPRRRSKSVIRHDKLNALVKWNPWTTVPKSGSELQTSPATSPRHLKKIGDVNKTDRFVPRQFNEIQGKPMFYSVFHVDFSVGKENHFFFLHYYVWLETGILWLHQENITVGRCRQSTNQTSGISFKATEGYHRAWWM